MKFIVLLLVSISALAASDVVYEVKYDSLELIEEFDYNFSLTSSEEPLARVNLDCQSFFKKYDFYQENQLVVEHYISVNECEALYYNFFLCIQDNGYKCIDASDPYRQECDCK